MNELHVLAAVDLSYRPIFQSARNRFDAATATTTTLTEGASGVPSGANGGNGVFYIDPADLVPAGRSCKLKLRQVLIPNATAPAADFTLGLYPVSASAGAAANVSVTTGTVVSGSQAAITAPPSGTPAIASAVFDCPVAGFYVLMLIISANMAVGSSAAIRAQLLARAV
jgi:hypothetical protein